MSELDEPERWEPVPNFTWYEGSTWARVRSVPHMDTNKHWHAGQILNPWTDEDGYLHVTLYRDGKASKPYLHQVIAWTFIGPRPPAQEVCHGRDGKMNNLPSNLSYGPHSKNVGPDKFRDGAFLTGDAHQNSKLTVAIVGECRTRYAAGEFMKALAAEFGVAVTTMQTAIEGRTWQDCPVPPVTGRRRGESHRDAKLTEAIIRECYARNGAGETLQALAREVGVTHPALYAAIIGKTWKHLRLDEG